MNNSNQKASILDFPGDLVINNLLFTAEGMGWIPSQGSYMPRPKKKRQVSQEG